MLIWIYLIAISSVAIGIVSLNIKFSIEDKEMERKAKKWMKKLDEKGRRNK